MMDSLQPAKPNRAKRAPNSPPEPKQAALPEPVYELAQLLAAVLARRWLEQGAEAAGADGAPKSGVSGES